MVQHPSSQQNRRIDAVRLEKASCSSKIAEPTIADGTSWENAYSFLQDALADANSAAKPVEIRVAQGIYTPDSNSAVPDGTGDREAVFQLINGVTLQGGYAGIAEPDPDARDVAAYETILSGDLNGDDVGVAKPIDFPTDLIWIEPTRAENSYHIVTGMQRFFMMIENVRESSSSDWLTVEEIAEELRISKNIVYRLIRNGELEAINIVDTNGHIAQRGHYRINRADLQKYVAAKKVKTSPSQSTDTSRSRRFPKVRNHLGL